MGSALDYGVWLANEPHAARPLIGRPVRQRAGAQMLSWSHMRKQPNGTFGKNPGAIGQGAAGPGASTADDAEPGRRPKPVRAGYSCCWWLWPSQGGVDFLSGPIDPGEYDRADLTP